MSDTPTDIGAERFRRASFSDEMGPRDVLAGLLAEIDAGRLEPDHVIVVMRIGQGPDGLLRYAQGGSADRVTQLGMLSRAEWIVQQ